MPHRQGSRRTRAAQRAPRRRAGATRSSGRVDGSDGRAWIVFLRWSVAADLWCLLAYNACGWRCRRLGDWVSPEVTAPPRPAGVLGPDAAPRSAGPLALQQGTLAGCGLARPLAASIERPAAHGSWAR